ncbi:putative IRON-SULFUR-BINDING REDUCTASE domain protein [Mycobacterium xenopi 3993]|nr:putative IRON-SULFUR-BINDING REDUCTASE domain protein [Mycobacterium xenopi 3993]
MDRALRGVRSAPAAEMVDSGLPLLHDVGLLYPAHVYIEAYGLLFQPNFHIPVIGRWDVWASCRTSSRRPYSSGFHVSVIRIMRSPREIGRTSRFYGSHTGGAWLILFMIFNVIWTYVLVRGSAVNNGTLPYGKAAFLSQLFA